MILPKDLLSKKHLLIDTNVLIELQKQSSEELKSFFGDIADADCALLTIDPVCCEFLAYAKDKDDYEKLLTFINEVAEIIPTVKEDLYIATQIYLARKNENKDLANKMSFVDRILGAVLARYEGSLFLATTNHRDFPISIYDREYVFGFENKEGNIQNICIIKFNHKKFKEMLRIASL